MLRDKCSINILTRVPDLPTKKCSSALMNEKNCTHHQREKNAILGSCVRKGKIRVTSTHKRRGSTG